MTFIFTLPFSEPAKLFQRLTVRYANIILYKYHNAILGPLLQTCKFRVQSSSTVIYGWCYHSIHKHSSVSTCTSMMTSGMHLRPFEGRHLFFGSNYASPTSGEAYRDRQLTTNFEFWVEIFCVPTCFHMTIPKPCLSVWLSVCLSVRLSICPYPEKRNHHSFVNISPTLVIDTSMERSSRVLHHGNPNIWFFFSKKFEIRILTSAEEPKSP